MSFHMTLNREPWKGAPPDPNLTLLQFLRREGCTGAKEGCAEGDCGACAVNVLEKDASGRGVWRAINSCLVPAVTLQGHHILTSEGIAESSGKLHPVQQCMIDHHGSQCGYCTPGFIGSLYEAWNRPGLLTQHQLTEQLAGNLCRCTGYRSIQDAACAALQQRPSAASPPVLPLPEPVLHTVLPGFCQPDCLSSLLEWHALHPDWPLVAGSTELGLEITKKFRRFPGFISLAAVPELQRLDRQADEWIAGAAVPLTNLAETVGSDCPMFGKMLWLFGSRLIRNRATLGGNLATASPIGDSAPVLLALDAILLLTSAEGTREVSIADFFTGYRTTLLKEGEILQHVRIPLPPAPDPGQDASREHTQFYKVSRRVEMDISTVSGAFRVRTDPEGIIELARLAFGGVAATPARALRAESWLVGKRWSAEVVKEAAEIAAGEFSPLSDVRGSAGYRRGLIRGMLLRFFEDPPWTPPQAPPTPVAPFRDFPAPHESAALHVTGKARYTDDELPAAGELTVWLVTSPHAHARILGIDAQVARTMPGIRAILLAEDVPGRNDVGAVRQDEPLLAKDHVFFHGHPVAMVVGTTQEHCRNAAALVMVKYEPLPAVTTLQQAMEQNCYHTPSAVIRRGDAAAAMAQAPFILEGQFELGGQEHFYLETHAARAIPADDGSLHVISSTQHPSEVQAVVSHVLHVPRHRITVESPRMGGGFGGKETQGNTPAALAALAAMATGCPVRVRLNRDQDMQLSGHRHPFLARFKVGFDAQGMLIGLHSELVSNGGWALDLSTAITDRALLHHDNAYFLPDIEVTGRVAKTNLSSNTAFRGFGGPQGMLVMEEIIHRVASACHLPPETVRRRNLYSPQGNRNTTPYGQNIGDSRLERIWDTLEKSSGFETRRLEIEAWNAAHAYEKRGLAMTPVKFGISFTVTHLNQAGALVLIYQDGTVQVNHGGTEMGQGLHTKIKAIVCRELGLTADRVRLMPVRTDKVPNTSATAASSGTDLNGAAVQNACIILRSRLTPVAEVMLQRAPGGPDLLFGDNKISGGGKPLAFEDVVLSAYMDRIPLMAAGSYATPEIGWDRVLGKGTPFYYFACGAAVAEVQIDGCTGTLQLRRVDLLHDVGDSLNAGVDRGQIEGGFVQGMGWLTMEELVWNEEGRLLTHSPDTYKIPAMGDSPADFRVQFLQDARQSGTIYGSKAVGEPPLMLAISVRHAILDAIAAFPDSAPSTLASPATGEAIWRAIHADSGAAPSSLPQRK